MSDLPDSLSSLHFLPTLPYDERESHEDWKVEHSLDEILTVVMCGVGAGERSIRGICAFAQIKKAWLRDGGSRLTLPHNLPSYDVIRRVMGVLSPKRFQDVFIKWIETRLALPPDGYVDLDGRKSKDSSHEDVLALYLLGAYVHESGIVIGQRECSRDTGSETVQGLELLRNLQVSNSVITGDAMMCSKRIASEIRFSHNDYVLPLKSDNSVVYEKVARHFTDRPRASWQRTQTLDKVWQRKRTQGEVCGDYVRKKYILDTDVVWFRDGHDWEGLAAVGRCENIVICGRETKREIRYFLTSVTDVEVFAKAVRSHWDIGNTFRWSLGVTSDDDIDPMMRRNTVENLAIVRRFIYNRISRAIDGVEKLSFGIRKCMYDDFFRARILFQAGDLQPTSDELFSARMRLLFDKDTTSPSTWV